MDLCSQETVHLEYHVDQSSETNEEANQRTPKPVTNTVTGFSVFSDGGCLAAYEVDGIDDKYYQG